MSVDDNDVIGFISRNEFDEGCQALQQLSLSSKQTAPTIEIREEGESQYLAISRHLLADCMAQKPEILRGQSSNEQTMNVTPECPDIEYQEDDEEDGAAIHHGASSHTSAMVTYDIVFSESYRVPILYFSLHNFPPAKSRSVDIVYDLLVPEHLKAGAKAIGVMGGIGMTNHPVTDIPCFWVHPCNTAVAMGQILRGIKRAMIPLEYLMIWIGVVGGAVGLSLPKDMITRTRESSVP